jgi:integrase
VQACASFANSGTTMNCTLTNASSGDVAAFFVQWQSNTAVLKAWRQARQFSSDEDWVFASPARLGRQPWSYDQVWRSFLSAAAAAGIGKLGTHSTRHTYRSWLDAAGTTVAVQQKLMRHGDIRTTMNVYGDVVTNEMQEAHSKVVQMALPKPN